MNTTTSSSSSSLSNLLSKDLQEWKKVNRNRFVRQDIYLYLRETEEQRIKTNTRIQELLKKELKLTTLPPPETENVSDLFTLITQLETEEKQQKQLASKILIQLVDILQEGLDLSVAELLSHRIYKIHDTIHTHIQTQSPKRKTKEKGSEIPGYLFVIYLKDLFTILHPTIQFGEHEEFKKEEEKEKSNSPLHYLTSREYEKRSFRAFMDVLKMNLSLGNKWDNKNKEKKNNNWSNLTTILLKSSPPSYYGEEIEEDAVGFEQWYSIFQELKEYDKEQTKRLQEFNKFDKEEEDEEEEEIENFRISNAKSTFYNMNFYIPLTSEQALLFSYSMIHDFMTAYSYFIKQKKLPGKEKEEKLAFIYDFFQSGEYMRLLFNPKKGYEFLFRKKQQMDWMNITYENVYSVDFKLKEVVKHDLGYKVVNDNIYKKEPSNIQYLWYYMQLQGNNLEEKKKEFFTQITDQGLINIITFLLVGQKENLGYFMSEKEEQEGNNYNKKETSLLLLKSFLRDTMQELKKRYPEPAILLVSPTTFTSDSLYSTITKLIQENNLPALKLFQEQGFLTPLENTSIYLNIISPWITPLHMAEFHKNTELAELVRPFTNMELYNKTLFLKGCIPVLTGLEWNSIQISTIQIKRKNPNYSIKKEKKEEEYLYLPLQEQTTQVQPNDLYVLHFSYGGETSVKFLQYDSITRTGYGIVKMPTKGPILAVALGNSIEFPVECEQLKLGLLENEASPISIINESSFLAPTQEWEEISSGIYWKEEKQTGEIKFLSIDFKEKNN